MSRLIPLVIETFDEELSKFSDSPELLSHVINYYIKKSATLNFHSFFITRSLEIIVSEVFNDPVLRDFILNLTIKCNILVNLEKIDDDITLIIENAIKPGENTLIPEIVVKSIRPTTSVRKLLDDNDWLLFLFITIVFFDKSTTFNTEKVGA